MILISKKSAVAGCLFCSLVLSTIAEAKPRSHVRSTDFSGKPVGVRNVGMGETGAATTGDSSSPVWNPACMVDLESSFWAMDFDVAKQSTLDTNVILGDTPLRGRKLVYLGLTNAESAIFFRPLANYRERVITNPSDPANNFEDTSMKVYQIGLTAAQTDKQSDVGLTISYLNARRSYMDVETGTTPELTMADGHGFSLDMGMRGRTDHVSVGLAFFNIPGIIYWNEYKADQLPVQMKAGIAFNPISAVTIASDYEKRFYRGGEPKPDFLHIGLELKLLSWFAVRGGTYGDDLNDPDKTNYTAGCSFYSTQNHRLDFAFRTYRLQEERVYNYMVGISLPISNTADGRY